MKLATPFGRLTASCLLVAMPFAHRSEPCGTYNKKVARKYAKFMTTKVVGKKVRVKA